MTDEPRPVRLESGIEVKPVYGPEDLAAFDPARDLGAPGAFPFTRGIHPLMYRKRPWTMRQYAGFGTPRQTNERFRLLREHGQDALNVAFDLPTQMGLDSDDPAAEGEVGRVGMAVDTLADFEEAFRGIPLGEVSISLTINAPAVVLLAMHLAAAKRQGVQAAGVRGTLQNDILKEFAGRGAWIFPVAPSVRLVVDAMDHCAREAPKYNAVSVCGYHLRESGAAPDQEIAYALSIARTYLEAARARGLSTDAAASQITFNLNVFGNLWEQVAKFRAGRRLWARLLRQECGARDPRAMQLRMIAGGGGSGLTVEEPLNNVIRGTIYALAGALGGTQTMALCCYDEAYTIPSREASVLALRTMQILAEEVGLTDTVDPLGGSYFIESLTGEMEKRIIARMDEVRRAGGVAAAIESGWLQRMLARQAYERERRIRAGEVPVVGVNRHVVADRAAPEVTLHAYDEAAAAGKVRELERVRRERDGAAARRALGRVEAAARSGENVVPAVTDAVEAYGTLGEIVGVLKGVFGEFREPAF